MSQQWKQGETGGDDDVQMPLGVGDTAATEEAPVNDRPRINTSTLALFAAFAAALIVLYLLGLQNKPRAATAEQITHEQNLASAIDEMIQSKDKGAKTASLPHDIPRLVQILHDYLGKGQTDDLELPGNPFERAQAAVDPGSGVKLPPVFNNNKEEAELRTAAETFAGLKLQSVMIGKTPAALINNRMVTVGARFGNLTISEIRADHVVLTALNNSFELKLAEPSLEKQ